MPDQKILIFIPTYNERENIEKLFNEITNLNLNLDFLFIDDNSPDGTGDIIESIARNHINVHVIHRSGKLGIGSAHLDGINWAYDHKYKILITMDCDFTHPPKYIPDFIRKSDNYDIVIGSRYLNSKGMEGWNRLRRLMTSMGHILTKHLLHMEYDATGAYRLYSLDRVPRDVFGLICSKGYSFFFESLFVLHLNRFSIKEISISLPPRNLGHSKITIKQIFNWGKYLFQISLIASFNGKRFKMQREVTTTKELMVGTKNNGWDEYWEKKNDISGHIYDGIAVFYRRYIIKGNLNRFVEKYFHNGARILHAGCGSGEVDVDISKREHIISVDLSGSALKLNRAINNNGITLVRGTIFNLPFYDSSFGGIYNLGVMEHFTESEINLILHEFKRIIKKDGKIILFWPPEFGLSVVFLKYVHFVMNRVLGINKKLFPDEITRIESKSHIQNIMNNAGLEIIEQSFSFRDLFTYYILVCEKPSDDRKAISAD